MFTKGVTAETRLRPIPQAHFKEADFYLVNQNKHKSIFVVNQLLDLLKHLRDQLTAL